MDVVHVVVLVVVALSSSSSSSSSLASVAPSQRLVASNRARFESHLDVAARTTNDDYDDGPHKDDKVARLSAGPGDFICFTELQVSKQTSPVMLASLASCPPFYANFAGSTTTDVGLI